MSEMSLTELELKELQSKARERTVKTQTIEYDLETLLKRINNETIKIDPFYQRRHRWKDETSSRLIESLILNIPIPTIYLSQDVDLDMAQDDDTPIFSVIDGQQRLTAIKDFMNGDLELKGLEVLEMLNGFTYKDLPKFLKRRLEDRTIGCLRIDSTVDEQVKFDIFERLNSGSIELTAQELRNAAYSGLFNDMIKKLSSEPLFQELTCMSVARKEKMEDVELVLRFFALSNKRYVSYKPNMKEFLNSSMKEFSTYSEDELNALSEKFHNSFACIQKHLGNTPFAKWKKDCEHYASRFNAAVYDAVIVAFDNTDVICEDAQNNFEQLFKEDEFQAYISGSINDATKLFGRIRAVEDAIRG